MRFTISTKPLKNVTDLGIIKANISKFYYRSNIVQITASRDTLKLNIEAAGIKTRMTLRGSGDDDTVASILVDCSMFKNLVNSIDSDVLQLEFVEGGLCVHAGASKFAIPQMLDVNDVQLTEPVDEYAAASTITINPEDWQFIKDHQMYAIASSAQHPVYTNVWVSADKDVIVGDYETSLFTYSKRGGFDTTCLFPASLINLFTSIPAGSVVSKIGENYVLKIETDSYSMLTEFTPKYEYDDAVGSYNSGIVMSKLAHPDNFVTVDVAPIIKFINQAAILNQSEFDRVLEFTVSGGVLKLINKDSAYTTKVDTDDVYTVRFISGILKNVLNNLDSDKINIAPMTRSEQTADGVVNRTIGCIFWTDNLTTIFAGQG